MSGHLRVQAQTFIDSPVAGARAALRRRRLELAERVNTVRIRQPSWSPSGPLRAEADPDEPGVRCRSQAARRPRSPQRECAAGEGQEGVRRGQPPRGMASPLALTEEDPPGSAVFGASAPSLYSWPPPALVHRSSDPDPGGLAWRCWRRDTRSSPSGRSSSSFPALAPSSC